MLNRLRNLVNEAVEVVAPPIKPDHLLLKDHFHHIQNFYNHKNASDIDISSTNIPYHLDQIIKYIKNEDDQQTGPCLEELLELKIPEILVGYAEKNIPPGMSVQVLKTFSLLVSNIHSRVLPEAGVRVPLEKLILFSHNLKDLKVKYELVVLINVVFRTVRLNTALLNLFIDINTCKFDLLSYLFEYITNKDTAKIARESLIIGFLVLTKSEFFKVSKFVEFLKAGVDLLVDKAVSLYTDVNDSSDSVDALLDYWQFLNIFLLDVTHPEISNFLIEKLSSFIKIISEKRDLTTLIEILRITRNIQLLDSIVLIILENQFIDFIVKKCVSSNESDVVLSLMLFNALLESLSPVALNALVLNHVPTESSEFEFRDVMKTLLGVSCNVSLHNNANNNLEKLDVNVFDERFEEYFLEVLDRGVDVWRSLRDVKVDLELNFLDLILGLLERFTLNSYKVNLVLSSVLKNFLVIPDERLLKFLLGPSKGFKNVFENLIEISTIYEEFLNDNKDKILVFKKVSYEGILSKIGFISDGASVEELNAIMSAKRGCEELSSLGEVQGFAKNLINCILFSEVCKEVGVLSFVVGSYCLIKKSSEDLDTN